MRVPTIFSFRRGRLAVSHVAADANALMEIWGETALSVAADLSWREDSGLLHTSMAGHWGRVHREIALRLGVPDGPVLDRRASAA